MAKSTLDSALAELDDAATTVLDIIAKDVKARAPDHASHADLSTIEVATHDLRVALRNR
jgi:hypothetical protein